MKKLNMGQVLEKLRRQPAACGARGAWRVGPEPQFGLLRSKKSAIKLVFFNLDMKMGIIAPRFFSNQYLCRSPQITRPRELVHTARSSLPLSRGHSASQIGFLKAKNFI